MAKKYCAYCGTEFSTDDQFCFKCGAKVNVKESVETPVKSSDVSDYYIPETTTHEHPKTRSKLNAKKIVTVVVIIGALLIPLSITMGVLSIKVPLGTLEYEVPDTGILDLDLIIDNEVGSIMITYDDSISNLFEAEIEVKGGLKADFENAVNFEHEVVGNTTIISFDSGDQIFSYFSLKSITYDIEIFVNPNAVYDFDIITATGSINFYLDGDDVQIEDITLLTSTGSIEFYSDFVDNVTMGDVSLKSSTGRVAFDLSEATNTVINDLSLECSTGSIYADLGINTELFDDVVGIYTSTGSIHFYYIDIILVDDILWNIETSTGSITFGIEQNVLPVVNVTSVFNVQTSTGSITVDCELDAGIGVEIDAETSTGSITLPNGNDYYISANYATAVLQYSFILATSTGSVSANL